MYSVINPCHEESKLVTTSDEREKNNTPLEVGIQDFYFFQIFLL